MMRKIWIVALVFGSVLLATGPRAGRGQTPDVERVLAERFGFSGDEVAQVRGGQYVVKTLPAPESAIAVGGVVRIPDDKDRLVRWIRDIEGFRKAADLGLSRKLSSPPAINDFGDLALDAGELAARCRSAGPGTARCAWATAPSPSSKRWTGAPPMRDGARTSWRGSSSWDMPPRISGAVTRRWARRTTSGSRAWWPTGSAR